MQTIAGEDYSTKKIMSLIRSEVTAAVNYIDCVINDYEGIDHQSEHFSDVLMLEDYEYDPNPTGPVRKSLRGRHGVYVFLMKNDLFLTYEQVRSYNDCKGAGFLNLSEKNLLTGQHFYQGSVTGEKRSLQTRMREHYSDAKGCTGISLNHPNRIMMKDKLKVFLFPVIDELKEEPFFIGMIEAELHKRYPAVTGSRKVM